LEASNEIVIDDIHVAPSRQEDEVKKRIGLPLGLIVALITDAHNGLKINLPMSGPLARWQADLSDAIWTAVKNVVVNVAAVPRHRPFIHERRQQGRIAQHGADHLPRRG